MVFTRAYSHVPLTTASHTTILTGTYPQFNHVNDFGVPLSAHLPLSCRYLLHQRGYHTGAFVASLVLDPLDGTAPGFDRGFDMSDAGFHLRRLAPIATRPWSAAPESWSSTPWEMAQPGSQRAVFPLGPSLRRARSL